jgi:drug/metabolite transporter (DMT)-like permease
VLAPIGAILIGTVPYFAVELGRAGVQTQSILFWRYCFALSLLLPLALIARHGLRRAWREGGRGLFLTSLTLGAFQTFCYFKAVAYIPTSIAILFFYAYPLMTLLLQRVLHGRRAPLLTALAAGLILAGAAAMATGSLREVDIPLFGLLLAAVVPVSYGFYILRLARYARGVPALAGATFIQMGLLTSYALLALPSGLQTGGDAAGWLRLFAIASVGSAVPMAIMAYCLPRLGPAGFGIMSSLELVTVVLLGIVLLGEALGPWQWAGIALVLGGILLYRPAPDTKDADPA